jgi:hypothetical protein
VTFGRFALNIIVLIQFISFLIYLHPNLIAQRPVTNLPLVRRKKQQNTNKIKDNEVYIVTVIKITTIITPSNINNINNINNNNKFLTSQQPKDQC